MLKFGLMLISVGTVLGRPTEEPTKFDLAPVQDAIENISEAAMAKLGQGQVKILSILNVIKIFIISQGTVSTFRGTIP